MALEDKFLVCLTTAQRAELDQMIADGRHAAAARVPLKADTGPAGVGGRRHRRGPRVLGRDRRPRPQAVRPARARRGRPPPAANGPAVPQAGRRTGSEARRPRLPPAARWEGPVDAADAGRPAGRTGGGGRRLRRDRPPGDEKNVLKPWLKRQWVIPPKANAEFVCGMEGVPDVYACPPAPKRPVVCAGEGGKRPIGHVREPLPVRPTSPAKEDDEYVRNGTADLFVAVGPLAGKRRVEVTERRRRPTSPGCSSGSATTGIPTPAASRWSLTTCRPTSRPSCTRCSSRPRRGGSWAGGSSCTRPSTGRG